jgi:predicted GNAT family N-acyltransferase
MPAVMALREEVFVREQGVPVAIERDARDRDAVHLLGEDEGRVIACCRLVVEGTLARLGRMAVAAPHRGRGAGARLLAFAEQVAREEGARVMALHAQTTARDFYARGGYVAEGDEFLDAGIVHVAMSRPI